MDLYHPDSGKHVTCSPATAELLLEEGWTKIVKNTAAEEPAAEAAPSTSNGDDGTGTGTGNGGGTPPADLPKKLGDLVKYAEDSGLFDADTIASWRKPGTKAADVRAAIEQKLAEDNEGA